MSNWTTILIKSYEVHDHVNGIIGTDMCFDDACELAETQRDKYPSNYIEVHAIVDA